jgi:hypothetical protein
MLTIDTYEFISHNRNFENHKKLYRHNVALAFATMLVTTKEYNSVATTAGLFVHSAASYRLAALTIVHRPLLVMNGIL